MDRTKQRTAMGIGVTLVTGVTVLVALRGPVWERRR
jgi:hypothetical protein